MLSFTSNQFIKFQPHTEYASHRVGLISSTSVAYTLFNNSLNRKTR